MMERMAVCRGITGASSSRAVALAIAACVSFTSVAASAQDSTRSRSAPVARVSDRPYTQAELGIGMLTLPATEFCLSNPGTCTRGDTNPLGYLMMMYRPNRLWGFGAGATVAMPSGGDKTPSTYGNLDRSHQRSYLLFDATVRYYALRLDYIEGWAGGTLGGVVINDLYKNNAENPSAPILGPKGVSIRTEGVSAGIEAGIGWSFANNWTVAGILRSAWCFLPDNKACGPTGDCATLSGQTAIFSLGAAIAYRIGL
jgi:hypothetical protein